MERLVECLVKDFKILRSSSSENATSTTNYYFYLTHYGFAWSYAKFLISRDPVVN